VSGGHLKALHLRGSCGLYGAEQVILDLVRHQPKLDVEPLVMDFRRPDDDEGPFLRAAAAQGCRALPLRCRGRFDLRAVRALRQLAIEEEIDVFHGHDYKANFYGYLALRTLPLPLVATNHGYDRQGLRLAFYHFLDSRLLRRMDAIIAVAESVAEAMARRGIPRDRVTIIRNGLDPQAFVSLSLSPQRRRQLRADLGVPDGRRIIGTVGRLEPQKGYDLLLAVFARLLAEAPDLHLVIVGDGSLRDVLAAQARELGVTDHVTFAGVRPDVTSILRVFSVFVSSSRSEGMPMAVLEAAALEVPIVATAVGDVPYLIEDGVTGKLVPPGAVDALTAAIATVLNDAQLARQLGEGARCRFQEGFLARESVRLTAEVYRQALSDIRDDAARVAALR